MKKVFELIVEGNVQAVGYRKAVKNIAKELGLKGQIENLEDEEQVKILVSCNKKQLKEFIKKIKVIQWPINVEKISKKELKEKIELKKFKIIRGNPTKEISQRMDIAAFYLQKIYGTLENLNNKTDKHINITKKFKQESNNNFKELDNKYGSISKILKKSDKKLGKIVKAIQS